MIFGKTTEQMEAEVQEYLRELQKGYIWFAWYPVQLDNGRWIWLEKVRVFPPVYQSYDKLILLSLPPNRYTLPN